jgi:transposase-like protein
LTRRRPATEAELQRALNIAATGVSQHDGARQMDVSRNTFEGWLRRAERLGMKPGHVGAQSEHERERIRLQDQIVELQSQLRTLHRDNLTAESVRTSIIGLSEQTPNIPGWVASPPTLKASHAGTPCTIWSDWHWGEVVDQAQVNGINSYSIAAARKRARALVEKTITLAKRHMVGTDYPGIVVNLGGDMISGDIHDELSETNELPTMPVLLDLMGVLIWALRRMADEFGRVFVPCVAGNHGRNTAKPRMKDRAYSNFDWLLYCLLEKQFEGDKRVAFHIPAGADAYYTVAGHRYLLTHGDNIGVKGGDGIIGLIGPVMRGDFKMRVASDATGEPYDTLLMGHWHTYVPLPRVIVNGSIKGYDEYAKLALRARPEAPSQALWFTHPEHGITSHWQVFVEQRELKASAVEWVSWPRQERVAA